MCGIFGRFGSGIDESLGAFEKIDRLMRHRGPDDRGLERGEGWALGFRRLSILDLSPNGHQPMRSPDGRYWIAFNGEIYNYLELRKQLEEQGERFHGTSDTEVLVRLLAREGAGALSSLNGMFAIAFVDTQARTFLLARDRLGVKPLYYKVGQGSLSFASELKGLLAWPDAERRIAPVAVVQYLALGYLPSETCIFSDCSKLPPGHLITGSLDEPQSAKLSRYWTLSFSEEEGDRPLSGGELDTLHDLLADAVRIRLRSDVPLGIFLSGGIDSGIVAALAAEASGRAPLALTVGFDEESADESALARASAEHAGLEHRIILQKAPRLDDIDRIAWYFDEPFGDQSALPTFNLCEAAAQHATVFLSGDGGDEAFAGYRPYIECQKSRLLIGACSLASGALRAAAHLAPEMSITRHRLLKLSLPDDGAAAAFDRLPADPAIWAAAPSELHALETQAGLPIWRRWSDSKGLPLVTRQQKLDYDLYLPDDILVKVDRASMAHSIEVRSPLLDFRLVEWAARLPRKALLNTSAGKLPLRALASRLLPSSVSGAVKKGFGTPLAQWFRQPAGIEMARERLLSPEAHRLGLWNPSGAERLLTLHQSADGRDFGPLLWRLVMLEAWARHYAEGSVDLLAPQTKAPRRRVVGE